MASGGRGKDLYRWLVILVLAAWGAGAALAPSRAQPPCLPTEDGRCLPAPALASRGPWLDATGRAPNLLAPTPRGAAALVRRHDSVPPARLASALRDAGHDSARGAVARGWWRVPLAPGESMDGLLARLRAMPEVAYAEEDLPVKVSYLPNDTYLAQQWALPIVEAPAAWDRTMGQSDVLIAVVDTGVDYAHPDAPTLLWVGWDFVNDDDDPRDDHGHGTHVAGIAAAATDNDRGVAGLCPGCGVLAIKVLDAKGRGWNSDVADGILYAAEWGAYYSQRVVINVSLGGGYSWLVADAVAQAQELGALVVAAAGNDGPSAPDYPAALAGVLAVAATDANDVPAGFSQYGDIVAPGVAIISTVPTWYASPPYQSWSGTSMACPLVAGAAGLVWSLGPSLSAVAVGDRLLATVDVPVAWNPAYGAGRLNVASALPLKPTPTLTFTPAPPPTFTATPQASPTATVPPTSVATTTPTPGATLEPSPTPTDASTPTSTATADPATPTDEAPEASPTPTANAPVVVRPGAPPGEPYVSILPLIAVGR